MRRLFLKGLLAGAAIVLCASAVQAAPVYTYVGSYAVFDGPYWGTNPPVYSADEAAALIFGGNPADYAISINPDTVNPLNITFTGWYDGWAEHGGMIFGQSYSLDLGTPGYNSCTPDAIPCGGSARSAYVRDGLFDTNMYRNYVWAVHNQVPTPEPSTMILLGAGMAGLAIARRLRKK